MATPPWTPAQAAEFEVEKVRLLALADDATRSFYLRIQAVREGVRAAAARRDAKRISATPPDPGRSTPTASSGERPDVMSWKDRAKEARWRGKQVRRRRIAAAFATWSFGAHELDPSRPHPDDAVAVEAPPPTALPPAPPTTAEQPVPQPDIAAAESPAAPAPALPPAAERRPQPPTLPDEPMQPPAVTGARAKMRTPPRCATAPPLPSVATAADPVDAASTTCPPDTPSATTPKAKRRLEPRLAGAAPAAAAAPHHPTMSPGPVPPHPAPKLPDAAPPPHAATSATATEVHASALPRAGTTPPPHPPSEAAAAAAAADRLRADRLRHVIYVERFQETRHGYATPHRTTADRRQDRRRSPRGTPHGGGPKGDTPPHA